MIRLLVHTLVGLSLAVLAGLALGVVLANVVSWDDA